MSDINPVDNQQSIDNRPIPVNAEKSQATNVYATSTQLTQSSELDTGKIVDKMIPHVEASVAKVVEQQAQKQEKDREVREYTREMLDNFGKNFAKYKQSNPEKAEKILKESEHGGKLSGLTIHGVPELFLMDNAPEILENLLENPDELSRLYNISDPMWRRDMIMEKNGEIKAKKGKKYFSDAPEPIDKIKDSGSTGMTSVEDLKKADFETYLAYREKELLREQGFTK
jgi:hypothetical protein